MAISKLELNTSEFIDLFKQHTASANHIPSTYAFSHAFNIFGNLYIYIYIYNYDTMVIDLQLYVQSMCVLIILLPDSELFHSIFSKFFP